MENRRVLLRIRPDTFFMIAKDNDERLGAEGKEVFILFDGYDAHNRDGSWGTIFSHVMIFADGKPCEGTDAFNGIIFLIIALQPYFSVRMGCRKSLKK